MSSGGSPPPRSTDTRRTSVQMPPERVTLIAAHAWDTHGAHQTGLTTGWVARLEDEFPAIYAPPDVTGQDLVEVVSGLLDLRPTERVAVPRTP